MSLVVALYAIKVGPDFIFYLVFRLVTVIYIIADEKDHQSFSLLLWLAKG
jgi:hypothetical protein